ncbi:hypothetical protein SteCoe_2215 [Stentor coeruleus]|uniref:START domain-containing protein n=1 Tax=Stentor coeruleus TaxID=5963 RepID=A0A1R2D023_9CILI|nr:hypothetical protein SteCoe_2215 [Stentor coeruleus]
MSACCFCFHKKKKLQNEDLLIQKEQQDHYQILIEEPPRKLSTKSFNKNKPESDFQLEGSIESTSIPEPSESRNSVLSVVNNALLYFPSNDQISPCSDYVTSQFHNFTKILELEASSDWEVKIDKPFACIMLKTETSSHPGIPILKAFFDMELDAYPQDLYEILYLPEYRMRWDTDIQIFYEIGHLAEDAVQYYMHNKAPWPFKDRDFVETRYKRNRVNGDIEILYLSLDHNEFPEKKEKAIRAETIIGGQIFRRRVSLSNGKPSLYVTTIFQADMKGDIPKKALKITVPTNILKWYRTVKKQLQIKIHS